MSGAGLSVEERQRRGYFPAEAVLRAPSLEAMRKLAKTGADCRADPDMLLNVVRQGDPGRSPYQILRVRSEGDSDLQFTGELVGRTIFFEICYDATSKKPVYVNIH